MSSLQIGPITYSPFRGGKDVLNMSNQRSKQDPPHKLTQRLHYNGQTFKQQLACLDLLVESSKCPVQVRT